MPSAPFEFAASEKTRYMLDGVNTLTALHADQCALYRRHLTAWGVPSTGATSLADVPYLPARAFKELALRSVPPEAVASTVMSSGTTGKPSRIFLDGRTALKQSRALSEILKSYLGPKKLPLLIIDSPSMGNKTARFSARSAGTLGFSMMANHKAYALDEQLTLDLSAVEQFLDGVGDGPFMLFGFTFLIWQALVMTPFPAHLKARMGNGQLFHGGGWKKLSSLGISNAQFTSTLSDHIGIRRVHNYYGMAEQTGSVFVECEHGKMHASKYSEVLIRDTTDLSVLPHGQTGVIQVFSLLPGSYPGHSILTEDIGWTEADQLCACGRHGTVIHIAGRLPKTEVRGCSDAY